MAWIDWSAVGKILGVGLLCGAGLPAIFAIGLKLLVPTAPGGPAVVGGPDDGAAVAAGRAAPAAMLAAGVCFAIVLAAIGYGIYLIVNG
jgi:hypothetical protein